MKESLLYKIIRPLINIYVKLIIRPKYIGLDNIPKKEKIILAGTHTSMNDSILLISSTKRPVHFLAKKELWKFPQGLLFSHLGLIPVDRKNKDTKCLSIAEDYLNDNKLVLIFPEGTIEKEHGKLLPFKVGALKLANDTNTKIVPFAIKGKYYKKGLTIRFGKPIEISKDLDKEKERLINIIEDLKK